MTTWFVTRHPGAVLWARGAGVKVADGGIVRDLDPARVEAGDLVVGTLPINLAAAVNERGARYLHMALEVPPEARGRELTPDEMRAFGARLEEYQIRNLGRLGVASLDVVGNDEVGEVMICIASGQPMANLLPLIKRKPRAVYVVQTSDSRARRTAERLRQAAIRWGLPCVVEENAPSSPLAAVESFADAMMARIRGQYPGCRLVLNATGGTKLMSLGFANRIGPVGEVIYCDTENERIEYFAPEGRPAVPMPPELMNLEQLLLVQGVEKLKADSDDADWMATARARIGLSRALAGFKEQWAFGIINSLAAGAMPKYRNGREERAFTPKQTITRRLSPAVNRLFDRIAVAGLWSREGGMAVRFTDLGAVRYLMGGWLEELTAVEMEALCAKAGIPDGHWAAGVEVRPLDAQSDDDKPFNEIDLAVVWRNRLLVVECKTGTQAGDSNESMNITNKLEAIRTYLGGPFSSTWLASARRVQARSVAAERCRQFGVVIVEPSHLLDIAQFVAGWMGLGEEHGARTDWAMDMRSPSKPPRSAPANGGTMQQALECAGNKQKRRKNA
jgi:putative CRISPR-associated protein (TIGR02620 family)